MSLATQIAATQASALKGYWKCDETSGTTLADSSGNSKPLTLAGTGYALNQSGAEGASIQFLGTNAYANRTDSVIGTNLYIDWTFHALVKGPASQAASRILGVGSSTDADPQGALLTGAGADANIRGIARNNANTSTYLNGGGTAFDNTWHSVVLRHQSTGINLFTVFVDGVSVHSGAASAASISPSSGQDRTYLGALARNASISAYFTGYIQHAAVWNVALTDTEIEDLYDALTVPPPSIDYHFTLTNKTAIREGFENVYYPCITDMSAHSTFPYDWRCLGSTDHGAGGIYMLVANGDPTVSANWLTYDEAKAAGGFDTYVTKPAANPIFNLGTSCETPWILNIAGVEHLYTHSQTGPTVDGLLQQATQLSTGTDGLNFTAYTAAPVGATSIVHPTINNVIGNHSGYSRPSVNPFPGIPFTYIGFSRWGTSSALWGSNDGKDFGSAPYKVYDPASPTADVLGLPVGYVIKWHAGGLHNARSMGDGTYVALLACGNELTGNNLRTDIYEVLLSDTADLLSVVRQVATRSALSSVFDFGMISTYQTIDIGAEDVTFFVGSRFSGSTRVNTLGVFDTSFDSASAPELTRIFSTGVHSGFFFA